MKSKRFPFGRWKRRPAFISRAIASVICQKSLHSSGCFQVTKNFEKDKQDQVSGPMVRSTVSTPNASEKPYEERLFLLNSLLPPRSDHPSLEDLGRIFSGRDPETPDFNGALILGGTKPRHSTDIYRSFAPNAWRKSKCHCKWSKCGGRKYVDMSSFFILCMWMYLCQKNLALHIHLRSSHGPQSTAAWALHSVWSGHQHLSWLPQVVRKNPSIFHRL